MFDAIRIGLPERMCDGLGQGPRWRPRSSTWEATILPTPSKNEVTRRLDAAKPHRALISARETSQRQRRIAVTHKPFSYTQTTSCVPRSRAEGTNVARETAMARSKPTARDALRKLREQRTQLENEEARLREESSNPNSAGC